MTDPLQRYLRRWPENTKHEKAMVGRTGRMS